MKHATVADGKEAMFAIGLLNAAIPEWNRREQGQLPENTGLSGPVAGLEFIDPNGREYRVLFRHVESGRVYGIVAPRYSPWVSEPAWSFRRVPLDRRFVTRVDLFLPLE